jgi:hypothetical protein
MGSDKSFFCHSTGGLRFVFPSRFSRLERMPTRKMPTDMNADWRECWLKERWLGNADSENTDWGILTRRIPTGGCQLKRNADSGNADWGDVNWEECRLRVMLTERCRLKESRLGECWLAERWLGGCWLRKCRLGEMPTVKRCWLRKRRLGECWLEECWLGECRLRDADSRYTNWGMPAEEECWTEEWRLRRC